MNIHPAFVHFPIAFLVAYVVIECIPFERFFPTVSWNQIKHFLLYAGVLAMVPTIATGLIAEKIVGESPLLNLHKLFAFLTFGLFVLASLNARSMQIHPERNQPSSHILQKILAFLGLAGLFTVGALGAAMVYGFHVDPIVSFITGLLGFK